MIFSCAKLDDKTNFEWKPHNESSVKGAGLYTIPYKEKEP